MEWETEIWTTGEFNALHARCTPSGCIGICCFLPTTTTTSLLLLMHFSSSGRAVGLLAIVHTIAMHESYMVMAKWSGQCSRDVLDGISVYDEAQRS